MKVLIAEDNAFYRTMLEGALKAWGYDVLSACDGEDAWIAIPAAPLPIACKIVRYVRGSRASSYNNNSTSASARLPGANIWCRMFSTSERSGSVQDR